MSIGRILKKLEMCHNSVQNKDVEVDIAKINDIYVHRILDIDYEKKWIKFDNITYTFDELLLSSVECYYYTEIKIDRENKLFLLNDTETYTFDELINNDTEIWKSIIDLDVYEISGDIILGDYLFNLRFKRALELSNMISIDSEETISFEFNGDIVEDMYGWKYTISDLIDIPDVSLYYTTNVNL